MIITQEHKEILEAGEFEGNIYKLPNIQLDRKMYKSINDILNTLGGKWKTRVGHIFDGEQEDLENALQEVLEKGETETLAEVKKRFQFFPTPKEVAEYAVELADIKPGEDVLEPSAGQGAIVDEIMKKNFRDIWMIELKEENYNILHDKYKSKPSERLVTIENLDFLDMTHHFLTNKIVMNPPFSKNQDVKHILKAYTHLRDGGRLVSIAPSNLLDKTTKLHEELKELNVEKIELPEGSFKESGTMVNTAIYIINK